MMASVAEMDTDQAESLNYYQLDYGLAGFEMNCSARVTLGLEVPFIERSEIVSHELAFNVHITLGSLTESRFQAEGE
jgi:hypothetical protein